MNYLFNDGQIAAEDIALIGQFAENQYFGKPCGLMDQLAIAVGGMVAIDFKIRPSLSFRKLIMILNSRITAG